MKPPFQFGPVISTVVMTAFVAAGCAKSPPAATPAAATAEAPAAATPDTASDAKAAELAAKEQELTAREAALKQQELEAELAKRDVENAAAAVAAAKQEAAKKAASKPAPTKSATTAAAPKPAASPPPKPITVPAGTTLAVQVPPLTTKTAVVGDHVDARLASDLVVDGRRAAKAGASIQGSITKVVSGSKKIGSTPVLKIKFDTLVAANGKTVTINAPFVQKGTSDTGKDTAKIVGGAAAGAIIGHQVSHDSGAVVGGLLGGAAGTAAAYKTGGEITLEDGQVVSVATGAAFEVTP